MEKRVEKILKEGEGVSPENHSREECFMQREQLEQSLQWDWAWQVKEEQGG